MMSTTAAHMANEAAADGAAMGKVVIPMMVTPITTKNSHISTIAVEIPRRVIRSIVTRSHNADASNQCHQERPAEDEPQEP